MTALWKAVMNGDALKTQEIITTEEKESVSLDARDKSGKTLLMTAAQSGFDDCVKILIDAGANVGDVTKAGKSALHFAISCAAVRVISLLAQADQTLVNRVDSTGSVRNHSSHCHLLPGCCFKYTSTLFINEL